MDTLPGNYFTQQPQTPAISIDPNNFFARAGGADNIDQVALKKELIKKMIREDLAPAVLIKMEQIRADLQQKIYDQNVTTKADIRKVKKELDQAANGKWSKAVQNKISEKRTELDKFEMKTSGPTSSLETLK